MDDSTVLAARPPDSGAFRRAIGTFPTGVCLLSSGSGPTTSAVTVNSVTAVSLDPLLVMVGLHAAARMRPEIEREGLFGLSVLGARHLDLSRRFAATNRPSGTAAAGLLGGGTADLALVTDAVAALECRVHSCVPGGDHVLYLGRVVVVHQGPAPSDALVFHAGRYARVGPTLPVEREDRP